MEKEQTINNDSGVIEKKARKTKKASQTEKTLFITLDNDTVIDLCSDFNWKEKLTERQMKFIFFYTYPFENKAYHNGSESARKAGYAKTRANIEAQEQLKNPSIRREKANIENQISEKVSKGIVKNEIQRILAKKIGRTKIRAIDFYDIGTKTIQRKEDCYDITGADIKNPDELTDEQKDMILDVEFVGQQGIPHYKLPNAVDAENDLIKLYKELFNEKEEESDGMEIETTAEIIKGNLQVKTKIIQNNQKISDSTDYVQSAKATGNTDLDSLQED